MTCERQREMISARLDDELSVDQSIELDRHLATCSACGAYEDQAHTLRRDLHRRASAELAELPQPDIASPPGMTVATALRWALFVIGGTLIIVYLANMFVEVDANSAHLSRHDAVFGSALGIGMLSVAYRPQRAIGLVPLTSTVALLMAMVAVADLVGDQVSMLAESIHVVEFAGLACLWVISGGPHRTQSRLSSVLRWSRRPTVPQWPTI